MTRDKILNIIVKDPWYDSVLVKYLSNKNDRDEFRQELWLIILQMKDEKLIKYYNDGHLRWVFIAIINNQLHSSTSPWHLKYRKHKTMEYIPNTKEYDDHDEVLDLKTNNEEKFEYIELKLKVLESWNPKLVRDISIFKYHFYDGMKYREISKKTRIPVTSVYTYIHNIINLLKQDLN